MARMAPALLHWQSGEDAGDRRCGQRFPRAVDVAKAAQKTSKIFLRPVKHLWRFVPFGTFAPLFFLGYRLASLLRRFLTPRSTIPLA
jgi:hypothetical protein